MAFPTLNLSHSRFAILLLALSIVNACGFHLRGEISLSGDIAPVFIKQNSAFELAREIRSLLVSNKIELAENSADAKTQLFLLNEAKKSRVLSVDGNGQAREYQLNYVVNIAIKLPQLEEIRESISVSRDLQFDNNAVLGYNNESEVLYKEMRAQAARLILLKLQALTRSHSLQTNTIIFGTPASDSTDPVAF